MGEIAIASLRCRRRFNELCDALKHSENRHTDSMPMSSIQNEQGRFSVWCGNLGALQKGHSALDFRLRESEIMRSNIVKLLSQLESHLSESIDVLTGKRLPFDEQPVPESINEDDNSSDDNDDDQEEEEDDSKDRTELDMRRDGIADILSNLYRLGYKIRNNNKPVSLKAGLYQEIDAETQLDIFSQLATFDTLHVQEVLRSLRSGRALPEDRSNYLEARLSGAITQRRKHFKYWEKHYRKLTLTLYDPVIADRKSGALKEDEPSIRRSNEQSKGKQSDRVVSEPKKPPSHSMTQNTVLSGTEASRYDPAWDEISEAATIISYASTTFDSNGRGVELPPPPKEATDGHDFLCPYCCILCPAKQGRGKAWRAHVLQDLQPYICTYPDCPDPNRLYRSRRLWLEHENVFHRRVWRCFEHSSAIFATPELLNNHLQELHAQSLSKKQITDLLDVSTASRIDDRTTCPVCLDATTAVDNLENHLANHLERIATFAFPRSVNEAQNSERGSDASKGLGGGSIPSEESQSLVFSDKGHPNNEHDQVPGIQKPIDSDKMVGEKHEDLETVHVNPELINSDPTSINPRSDQSKDHLNDSRLAILRSSCINGNFESFMNYYTPELVNVPDEDGWTLFHFAAAFGHTGIVDFLIDHGGNPESTDNEGETPLMQAVRHGRLGVAHILLKKAKVNPRVQNHEGKWVLDLIRPDVKNADELEELLINWTSLSDAVALGPPAIKQVLLSENSNDKLEPHPLVIASRYGHAEAVSMMLRESNDQNLSAELRRAALSAAVMNGQDEIVKLILPYCDSFHLLDEEGRTPLSLAAEHGHGSVVKTLLVSQSFSPDFKNDKGRTALSLAAENGHDEVVKLLLEDDAVDPSSEDISARTALSWAAENGQATVVKLLLEHDSVHVNEKDYEGRTPLAWAAKRGHENVVKLLMEDRSVDPNIENYQQRTPLSWAAQKGHEAIVKLLLEYKSIHPNLADSQGRTPLSWAAEKGHEKVVKLLLEDDSVDPSLQDNEGRSPLSWAAKRGHETVVKLLLEHDFLYGYQADMEGKTPLLWAAENGHEKVVKLLLEDKWVDPNIEDHQNRTALSWAAANGHEKVVQLLLERELVNVYIDDIEGESPLSWAAKNGHDKVVKLLLQDRLIKITLEEDKGITPMRLAVQNGHTEVIKSLIAMSSINPDSADRRGRTYLSVAAEKGYIDIVDVLLDTQRVNPDSRDQDGRTPLSWAAGSMFREDVRNLLGITQFDPDSQNHEGCPSLLKEVVVGRIRVIRRLLANHLVNPNSRDRRGRTPLSWAVANGNNITAYSLLKVEAVDIDSLDREGRTPLSYASENGLNQIVFALLKRGGIQLNSRWLQNKEAPLTLAVIKEHEIIVKALLAQTNIEVNILDRSSRTPLSHAAESGNTSIVQQLLSHKKIEPNLCDQRGWTPLHFAAKNGREEAIRLLISHESVDRDLKDIAGRTPHSYAVEEGHPEAIISLLGNDDTEAVYIE